MKKIFLNLVLCFFVSNLSIAASSITTKVVTEAEKQAKIDLSIIYQSKDILSFLVIEEKIKLSLVRLNSKL